MTTYAGTAVPSRAPRWLILIEGIASITLGVLLLTQTRATVVVLVQFLGAYWLVSGVFTLVSLIMDRERWGWKLLTGVVGILAGLTVLGQPLMSAILVPTTFAIIIAIQGIVLGVIMLFGSFRGGGVGSAVAGVVSIIMGVILLLHPLFAAATLVLVLAWTAIIGGVATCISAFRHR